MLARISGRLVELSGNRAVLEPSGSPGLGYEVLLPAYLAERAGAGVGEQMTVETLQYLESINQGASFIPRLIGFSSPSERAFFELLTSVKGLGNKRALRAMAVPPASIARAISDRDAGFLQRLPEIGPKLAELIVHELKNKVDAFAASGAGSRDPEAPAARRGAASKASGATQPEAPGTSRSPPTSPPDKPGPAARTPGGAEPRPRPPIRETVEALIALGETPIDAERMVSRAIERAASSGDPVSTTQDLLSAAYAARG